MEFSAFLFIVAGVLIAVVAIVRGSNRSPAPPGGTRACGACGTTHPPAARFCRKCGKPL